MTIAVYEAMDMHIKSNGSLDLKSLLVNKMRYYRKKIILIAVMVCVLICGLIVIMKNPITVSGMDQQ